MLLYLPNSEAEQNYRLLIYIQQDTYNWTPGTEVTDEHAEHRKVIFGVTKRI